MIPIPRVFMGLISVSSRNGLLWFVRSRSFSISTKTLLERASKDGEIRMFLVAGEVSGDTIGGRLMSCVKKTSSLPVQFQGIGGSMMAKQGLQSLFPMEEIAVMGIWELLPHLCKIRAKLNEAVDAAFQFQPHAVVTIDAKGFSFRLLRHLRAKCVRQGVASAIHIHYVAPSFWAWKGGESRLKGLSDFVDHILCILPFEEEVCRANGLCATFVGHPVLEDFLEFHMENAISPVEKRLQGSCEDFRRKYGISSGVTIITLLPGSRLQEVTRMLPIFLKTVKLLKKSFSELTAIIHVAPNRLVEKYISEVVKDCQVPVTLIPGGSLQLKYQAFYASRVALCTSGTVAVELQLARLPCLVTYRAHFLTEWFVHLKANIPYISLSNILLNSPIMPEALFRACTPPRLSTLLRQLMQDEALREKQIAASEKVFQLLQPPNFSQGDLVLKFLNTPSMLAASAILFFSRMHSPEQRSIL